MFSEGVMFSGVSSFLGVVAASYSIAKPRSPTWLKLQASSKMDECGRV